MTAIKKIRLIGSRGLKPIKRTDKTHCSSEQKWSRQGFSCLDGPIIYGFLYY